MEFCWNRFAIWFEDWLYRIPLKDNDEKKRIRRRARCDFRLLDKVEEKSWRGLEDNTASLAPKLKEKVARTNRERLSQLILKFLLPPLRPSSCINSLTKSPERSLIFVWYRKHANLLLHRWNLIAKKILNRIKIYKFPNLQTK